MPLPAIPPDPEPTEEQCRSYLDGLSPALPSRMRIGFASFFWKYDLRKREPDRFLVPFANQLPEGYYKAYQASPLWQSIRARVLAAANYECACCTACATEVHHRDYRPRVLSGEDTTPLVAICRKCHEEIESVKLKESWNSAEALLFALIAKKEAEIPKAS